MQVAPQPAPFLLARRDDRHARPPQVGGQPHPAHGEAERADELLEDLAIAGADRGSVGPSDDQPADDLVAMAEQDLAMVCGVGTGRRRPLPATGSREVDGHEVEAELALETGHESREQVVARVGADVVDDALHDAERVVASAVHEAVDEALDPMPCGLGDQRDRAGRGDEEPRRTVLAEQAPEPADETRVHDARSRPPSAPTPGPDAMSARDPTTSAGQPRPSPRRRATAPSPAAGAPTRRRARERPVDEVEARRHDRQPRGDRAHEEPTIERIAVRAEDRAPVTAEQADSDRGRRWRSARSRSRRRRAARCAGRSPSR